MSELGDLLRTEMERTKSLLVTQYDSLGLRASGSYEKELEPYVKESGNNIKAGILGAPHSRFMEEGRGPNKRQDRGMIAFIYVKLLEWMKVKGITDINPWMAARKIVREGITVPNKYNKGGVISGVIDERWLEEIQGKILDYQNATYIEAVTSELKSIAV
jgi:hypothetical protein